jgi:hypothetical protein
MANTVGLDGFIVIGYDDRDRTFHPVTFTDSQLRDTSELPGVIIRHVDRAFDMHYYPITVKSHTLNVLHFPPSLDKPHVIRLHRTWSKDGVMRQEPQRVYHRIGSRTVEADKYAIDLMYYDRKNVEPEYKVYGTIAQSTIKFSNIMDYRISNNRSIGAQLALHIGFENVGKRTIAVKGVTAIVPNMLTVAFDEQLYFTGYYTDARQVVLRSGDIAFNAYELISNATRNNHMDSVDQFLEGLNKTSHSLPITLQIEMINGTSINVVNG